MENLLYELALFTLLGVLYYFYQKKKILSYEENKGALIMGYILQACLSVRGENPEKELDPIIESLDDYLQNKTLTPPTALLSVYANSSTCPAELKDIILQGIEDLNDSKK